MFLIKNLKLPNHAIISWNWDGTSLHLTGANGVGKSLLLKALASLYPVSFDEFIFQGKPRDEMGPELYRSIVLYLSPQLSMSSFEKAKDFFLAPRNFKIYHGHSFSTEFEIKLKEWNIFDKKCTDLSSGEKQLLILARAFSLRAEVILMDEVLSHLDSDKKNWVLNYMRTQTQAEKCRYILIGHHSLELDFLKPTPFSELLART
jgi:ABC-type iron transport system FetAB ATPase subunit